ncbi:MAG: zinc-dependent metalloprotease [Nocardioides sp.]|jgi:coenzyme F420 biosynthesis associated uncharacterized protein
MIDWDLAVRIGSRLAGEGPSVDRDTATAAVAELRAGANRSTDLVREFTGLDAPPGTAPILVVDRPAWIQANADGFAKLMDPIVEKLASRKGISPDSMGAIGAKVTGAEVGLMLGFLAGKVLGQFDPMFDPHGRLLLVAPNIVHVERELDAVPSDFRLWVCLHEETHRVQFTAVPWMRDHLFAQVQELAERMEPASLEESLKRVTAGLSGKDGGSIVELLTTDEQREVLDRVTGMMSLLEGHADVVMDGVGPSVIPTVADIRAKFTQRRKGVGALDRLVRRLLGLDAKMAQYRDGANFVRKVVDKVGMEDFNAVWSSAETLPSKAEIHDPEAWVLRVHG